MPLKCYMVRHKPTGEFYRRGGCRTWGPQKNGSIWPSRIGPAAALSAIGCDVRWKRKKSDCEVLEFDMILSDSTHSA